MEWAYEVKIILHGRTELIGGLTSEQKEQFEDAQKRVRAGILNTEIRKIDEQIMNIDKVVDRKRSDHYLANERVEAMNKSGELDEEK